MTGHGGPDPMTGLHESLGELGMNLAWWNQRETARDQAAACKAGSTAVDAIDSLLRDLFLLRGRLTRELRADDDALLSCRREHVTPAETGEPWRGPAQGDWDDSR